MWSISNLMRHLLVGLKSKILGLDNDKVNVNGGAVS
jgi:acetyl-CoA acetyltransferase